MAYWLVKTEPENYSIDDLQADRVSCWDNVRNYQARNYLQQMKRGDRVLIYHSNTDPNAIVGLAAVAKTAYPDPSQFDKKSEYYDPKATAAAPRWFAPDLRFLRKFRQPVTLPALRTARSLQGMVLLQRGSRLSVQPVTKQEFEALEKISRAQPRSKAKH